MKSAPLEVTRGSGNVYRDFGYDNPDARLLKDLLAAEIIKTLERETLSMRQAHARTGVAAADFSRICNADLSRFTLDRLMTIINKLGTGIDIKMKFKPIAAYSMHHESTVLMAAEPTTKYGSKKPKK